MLSAKTIKILIYVGIIAAFLAVPIGSYWLVKRANDKLAVLQAEMANVKAERDGYAARIEFIDKIKEIEKETHEESQKEIDEIEHFGKRVDDMIRLAPKTDSSEVLKNTVKMLKERAK
ncbi:hypothetical protein AU106_gp035 [Sinorhizobium phage phiM9]|uniref:Uncharacterized protein n=1 Tax=Sinorhizobium phage phiM9 TaxID=1636182 RepID=A0A0F6TH21_9CAUD|nr:hypothetical protein AU106_gp035 [Sinorhizobium phage phiM9]AKE44666.1 hypothetical protein Sm_phiM9_036 [Sinorhizobium phage phiM9]